ncbi:MAG: TldD/PmbA family protein [Candidatus Bathyarchaeia archaeon]
MGYVSLCEKVLKSAEKLGAKEAEALIVVRRMIGVEIERGEIKTCSDIMDSGLGVRAITDKKIGFAFTNILTRKETEETARRAVEASKASPKDKNWKRLPEKQRYPTVKDIYDKKITRFTSDEAVALSQTMINTAYDVDKRVLPAFGGAQVAIFESTCLNNHGVEAEDKGTSLVCSLATMARSKTQVSPECFEFKASRKYEPDPEWVAREAANLAIQAINVGKAKAGKFPVLLDPFALQSILTYTLVQSVRGDIVARGRSVFKNKIGKKVAGENITIYDNGTLPGGLRSGKMDMEGVPRQKTPIIEEGVLHGFLYNNYWARLEGKESTGNAGRGGGGLSLPPYGTIPTISPTNIQLTAGTFTEEELLEEVKDGYYVRNVQGAHQSNPETGEFSVALAPAWRIQKGEITHAVKGVMIAGNAYDMLKKISALGKETRQVGTFVAPRVVVSQLNLIAK